jgi:putative FmdB family regulatory protein
MPTYEYACAKCGHNFEISQPMSAAALTTCPKEVCPKKPWGKGKVKRTISGGAGLLFKGSGFYITDYRSDNYKAGAKKDTPPSSTPAKTEPSKPAPSKPKSESK